MVCVAAPVLVRLSAGCMSHSTSFCRDCDTPRRVLQKVDNHAFESDDNIKEGSSRNALTELNRLDNDVVKAKGEPQHRVLLEQGGHDG